MKKVLQSVLSCLFLLNAAWAQEASSQPFALSPWVLHAKIKQEVLPEYPKIAIKNHIQGDITIDVVIDPEGNVANATWVNDGTSTLLSEPALEAVRKWKYQTTLLNGNPVSVSSWAVIRFQLADKPTVQILTRDENTTPTKKAQKLEGPFRIRVSSGVADSHRISGEDPDYPLAAKRQNIHGDVVLRALTDEKGSIVSLQVISGDPILAEAALAAVKTWKYRPFIFNGEPVEMETTITVRFHMSR